MKKGIILFLSVLLCFTIAACAEQKTKPPVSEQSSGQEQSDTQNSTEVSENQSANSQELESSNSTETSGTPETGARKIKLAIDGQEFDVTLYHTPAANALYDMLPLELTLEDFNGIEKIAYMENELPTEGEPDEFDPDVGDLCLYVPWGNLSIFYKDFRSSNGLISLGHIDSGMDIISGKSEDFSALLEKAEQ